MPSFASLRTARATPLGRRAPHRLAYALLSRIKAGVFSEGDWLPTEHELRNEFPASRTTLREALIILECLGLVESHHGVGSQVVGGHAKSGAAAPAFDLLALIEACRAFEVEAAGLAASLDEDDGSPASPAPSLSAPLTAETCRGFHVALARRTGNRAIWASVERLWDRAVARPDIRSPLDAALARSERPLRVLQARVMDALATRSPPDTRRALRALFDGYLAAVMDFEHQERLARIQLGGDPALGPDGSRLNETKRETAC